MFKRLLRLLRRAPKSPEPRLPTVSMLCRVALGRLLFELRGVKFSPNALPTEYWRHVDITLRRSDLCMTLDDIGDRFLARAMRALAKSITITAAGRPIFFRAVDLSEIPGMLEGAVIVIDGAPIPLTMSRTRFMDGEDLYRLDLRFSI